MSAKKHIEKRVRQTARIKHKLRFTPEYICWVGMITRCYNEKNKAFKHYGGRGIFMCERWMYSFLNFFEDMGERPPGLQLDRIDNNGPYSPENCRWATRKQQCRNHRNNRIIEYRGESKTMAEWCELLGLRQHLITQRLNALGWTVEKAFEAPVRKLPSRKRP